MFGAGAKFLQRRAMGRRRIAGMRGKTIAGMEQVEPRHQPVARHLGDDRSGGDGQAGGVAVDHGAAGAGQGRQIVAVDQRRNAALMHQRSRRAALMQASVARLILSASISAAGAMATETARARAQISS